MEEEEIIKCLEDAKYRRRAMALNLLEEKMCNLKDEDSSFRRPCAVFKALSTALSESMTESTQLQCLNVMIKIIPLLKKDADDCMSPALPAVFKCFVHARSSVRKRSVELWDFYVKYTNNYQLVVSALAQQGFNSNDSALKEFLLENLFVLIDSRNLGKHIDYQDLVDRMLSLYPAVSARAKENTVQQLNALKKIIGKEKYSLILLNSPHHPQIFFEKNSEPIAGEDCLPKLGPLTSVLLSLFNGENSPDGEKAAGELYEVVSQSFVSLKPNLDFLLRVIKSLLSEYNRFSNRVVLKILKVVGHVTARLAYENMEYLELTTSILVDHLASDDQDVLNMANVVLRTVAHYVPSEFLVASFFPYMKPGSPDLVRKCCFDCVSLIYLSEPSELGGSVDPLRGINAHLVQLIIGSMISPCVPLKLAAFECLAVVSERFDFSRFRKDESFHERLVATLLSHLEYFDDRKLDKNDKRYLVVAMKTRILRDLLPTVEQISGHLVYGLALSCHKGPDVDWIKCGSYKDLVNSRWRSFHGSCHSLPRSDVPSKSRAYSADKLVEQERHDTTRHLTLSLIPRPIRRAPWLANPNRGKPSSVSTQCSSQQSNSTSDGFASSSFHTMIGAPVASSRSNVKAVKSSSRIMHRKYKYRGGSTKDGDEYNGRIHSLNRIVREDPEGNLPKRQSSCGPSIGSETSDLQPSAESICHEYDMRDLERISEAVSSSYVRIDDNASFSSSSAHQINTNINNFRLPKQLSDVTKKTRSTSTSPIFHLEEPPIGRIDRVDISGDQDSIPPLPKFPWKSKRKLLTKKKFYMEEAQTDFEIDNHQIPVTDPSASYNEALLGLSLDKWTDKCQGLETIRTLTACHQNLIKPNLTFVTRSVLKEVRNLRSKVSLLAMVTLGEMFVVFQKLMDKEVDEAAKVLLSKSGESNKFIREEAERSLANMAGNVSVNRFIAAIIPFGTSHKNVSVQRTTTRLIKRLLDDNGADRILQGKDIAEKFLPACVGFLLAGSQVVRDQGHVIMRNMMTVCPDFDRLLSRHVPENIVVNVQDKLDAIRSTITAGGATPSHSRNSSSRTEDSDGPHDYPWSQVSTVSEVTQSYGIDPNSLRFALSAPDIEVQGQGQNVESSVRSVHLTSQLVAGINRQLCSKDWRERHAGLESLEKALRDKPAWVFGIVELMDNFLKCMRDRNEEVTLKSLTILDDLLTLLFNHIKDVETIINVVVVSVNSSNKRIVEAAFKCLDSIMELFEPFSILPVFINHATKCRKAHKVDFIRRVHYLYSESVVQRPVQSSSVTFQFLWHLLGFVNRQRRSLEPSINSEVSTSQMSPNDDSSLSQNESDQASSGRAPSPVQRSDYEEIYAATRSLLITINYSCHDNLEFRSRKLKPQNRCLLAEMLSSYSWDLFFRVD